MAECSREVRRSNATTVGGTNGMSTGEPSEKAMARLSFKITSCWYVLGILLDVDPDTLDIIRANNVELPNPQQKAHEMLRRWLDQSSHPTQESLANALRSVQKHDLMKEFYSELSNDTNSQSAQDFQGNTESPTPKLPQTSEDQIQKIESMLKKEYSERETTYVTPFPWLEDWQLALNDIFIKVRMVGRDTQRSGQLKTKERDMYDVFEGHEHCESPRIVLVEGAPGSGKTVFCQKLATDWSKGQTGASFPHFRVVLNLKCRDIFYTSGELDAKALKDSIVDQLLPPDAPEELKEALFEYVETDNCEVLLILDGLDECKRAVDLNSLKKQLRSWHCKFLFTSRNEPKLRRSCDSLYQIVEFTDNDAVTYIEKFFGDEGEEMAASLIAKIGSDSLHDLVTNPLTTSLVCFVFNETGGELPPSKAKLYEELTRCVLLRKYKKDRREAPEDPLKTHEEDLAVLGRLALKGIDKGQLHFEEHEFNAEGRASDVLRFGFLIREKTASKRVNSPHGFQFVHKTLQEYFAAFYLCTQLLSHDSDDCLRLLDNKTEEELSHQYKQVLRFLVGMLSAKGEQAKSVARDLFTSLARRESEQVFFSGFICDLLQECASVNPAFSEAMVQPVKDRWECRELRLDGAQTNEADVRFRVACAVVKADRPLECLSFNYNSLCDLSSLAEALHSNRSLRWLRFRGCPLTAKSLGTLAVSLTQNRTLKKLSLDRRFKDFQALKNLQELNPRLGIAFI